MLRCKALSHCINPEPPPQISYYVREDVMGIKWVDVCKAHDNNSQNKAISIAITYIIKATVI